MRCGRRPRKNCRSRGDDKYKILRGSQGATCPLSVFLVTFCTNKKWTGVRGRGGPGTPNKHHLTCPEPVMTYL